MSHGRERMVPDEYLATAEDYLIYLLHICGYRFAHTRTRGMEVLDYGCGTGFGAAEIAHDARRVVAADISAVAIEQARSRYRLPDLSFELIAPDEPLPFPDHSFDIVISSQVIEHIRDADGYLAEASRVLRPGGQLVLATPDRRTRLFPGQRPWNRWHVTEFSERTLRRLIERHFSEVEVLAMSGRPEVLQIELRRTRRAKWLALPITLPLVPDRIRTTLLGSVARLRDARSDRSGSHDPQGHGFDEQALWVTRGARPAVNLVAVARN